jgi:hypothetical protein
MNLNLKKVGDFVEELSKAAGIAWGSYHIFQAIRGKEVPEDSPSVIAKGLSKGGIRSADDQIIMDEIEQDAKITDAERELWMEFKTWIRDGYGKGAVGRGLNYFYWENFRSYMVRMQTPEQVVTTTRTTKGKPPIETKRERKIPANRDSAVDFLKRLIGEIQSGIDETSGSKRRKQEAGHRKAIAYLNSKSFPTPWYLDKAKSIDDAIQGNNVSANVSNISATISAKVSSTLESAGTWIDSEHDELEARNNQEGRLAGIRRWYRSLR